MECDSRFIRTKSLLERYFNWNVRTFHFMHYFCVNSIRIAIKYVFCSRYLNKFFCVAVLVVMLNKFYEICTINYSNFRLNYIIILCIFKQYSLFSILRKVNCCQFELLVLFIAVQHKLFSSRFIVRSQIMLLSLSRCRKFVCLKGVTILCLFKHYRLLIYLLWTYGISP